MLSTPCKYALVALTRIAREVPAGGFMLTREIVSGTKLPASYLSKVMQDLVRGNVLVSAKGRRGGFALRKPAAQITLRHIVEAIEGPLRTYQCIFGDVRCDATHPCNRVDRWKSVYRSLDDFFDRTTLADLAR